MAATQRRCIKILLALVFCGVWLCEGEAMAQRSRRRVTRARDTGQPAIVIVDGAAIYEKANFDSPVMDYLERGKKVLISKKIYRGAGGLGAFYKIRVRKGVFGYITDVDVQIDRAAKEKEEARAEGEADNLDPTRINPDLENPDPDDPSVRGDSLYFTRYIGGVFNNVNYAETIAKKRKTGSVSMFGMKMTGPGKVMGGATMDYEVIISASAPDFYDKSFKSAKGFLLIAHAMPIFPLAQYNSSMIYYGFGLVGKYAKFDIVTKAFPDKAPIDSQEFNVGIGGILGFAYSVTPRWALRLDGKYYYEKESYVGYGASIQMKY